MPALSLEEALAAAAHRVMETLACDKVDAFLLDQKHTLRAVGTSDTPMGRRQHELGLDALPLANGGRIVEVFKTGTTFIDGHAENDPTEVRGIVTELGVRSSLIVPFQVDAGRRGVLSAVSARTDFFQPSDARFLEAVARWVGMLAHRAALAELERKTEVERARRLAADEIVTVLAHDLRNHLQPLLSRLHLIRLRSSNGEAARIEDVDRAMSSVQRISRLTSDLLDVRRLDEGLFYLDLAPLDLARLAREVASSFTTPAVELQVTGKRELIVIADAERVRQALENVIANAVKHSPPGRNVRVHVAGADDDDKDERAVVEISDAGPGISPEVFPNLFTPFASGPGSKGLGLGLYLAHRIARAHGGDLTVRSSPSSGSCFRLILPFQAVSERAPGS